MSQHRNNICNQMYYWEKTKLGFTLPTRGGCCPSAVGSYSMASASRCIPSRCLLIWSLEWLQTVGIECWMLINIISGMDWWLQSPNWMHTINPELGPLFLSISKEGDPEHRNRRIKVTSKGLQHQSKTDCDIRKLMSSFGSCMQDRSLSTRMLRIQQDVTEPCKHLTTMTKTTTITQNFRAIQYGPLYY